MKKTYILIATLLIAVACKENKLNETFIPGGIHVKTIEGTISADDTKSWYEFGTDDNNAPILYTGWLAGDMIFVTDGSSDAIYTSQSQTSSCENAANFTGDGYFEGTDGLWAVSPSTLVLGPAADGALTVHVNTVLTQDSSADDFTEWSKSDLKAGYTATVPAEGETPSITFNNLLSVLRIRLRMQDTSILTEEEMLESVTITALNSDPIAGDFRIALNSSSFRTLSPVSGASEIIIYPKADTEIPVKTNGQSPLELLVPVAPGQIGKLLITIKTEDHHIQREIPINTTLERNKFYNVNLTSINASDPYEIITDVPVPEGGWKDQIIPCTSGGVVTALWDGIYGDDAPRRYYTFQLATASDFNASSIVLTTNLQITLSSLVQGETMKDGRVTICGLQPNKTYYYRVKKLGVDDAYYSSPANEFTTIATKTASAMGCNQYVSFDDVLPYATGDIINGAVATFPGATPNTTEDDEQFSEKNWNERLGFVDSETYHDVYTDWTSQINHVACYRLGNAYGCMAINSNNPFTKTINGVSSCTRVFNRPGYIQLGTTTSSATNHLVLNKIYNSASQHSPKYTIKFKACPLASEAGGFQNGTLNVALDGVYPVFGIDNDAHAEQDVTISASTSYTMRTYTVTLTLKTGNLSTTHLNSNGANLTLTAKNGVRVLIDDLQITKN